MHNTNSMCKSRKKILIDKLFNKKLRFIGFNLLQRDGVFLKRILIFAINVIYIHRILK